MPSKNKSKSVSSTKESTKTRKRTRISKTQKKKLALRNELWKKLDTSFLWNRKTQDGYTTIPRTLPLICAVLNKISTKGKPISSSYFSLWGRVWDDSFIEIKNPIELAYESGFSGQRAVSTWNNRMKQLKQLGFIDAKHGISGDFSYILVYNPYIVIKKLYDEGKIQQSFYNALYSRAQEIGADDLN